MLVNQLALVLASCALGGAALRVASRVAAIGAKPAGGEQSLVELSLTATVTVAGFLVCWMLLLGLAGLSGSIPAEFAGPVLAWVLCRLAVRDSPRMLDELLARWNGAARWQRTLALTVAGVAAGAVIEVARQPGFDVDTLSYHIPDVLGWLRSGHAGAVQSFSYDLPVGNYPVTGEVLLSWSLGISRTFVPVALYSTAAAALALGGMWRLLDVLRVPRAVAAAAVVSFGTLPIMLIGVNLNGAGTDLPAVSWLACAAALAAGAEERPALLAGALLAAGLGIGTKTTVAPLAAVALLFGFWRARNALRPVRRVLSGGAIAGLLVSAPWYLRNTITHGWPLWPFTSGPTGDRVPHVLTLFQDSFAGRPLKTLRVLHTAYLDWFAGGLGLMAGVLAIAGPARSRPVRIAAAVAVGALLAWALAPFTGVSRTPLLQDLAGSAVRYILAALGACVVALALAARDGGVLRRNAVIVLFVACSVGSVVSNAALGFPQVPDQRYLFAGAAAGALVGAVAPALTFGSVVRVSRVAAAVVTVSLLALSAPGWLWRESFDGSYEHALLRFMLTRPGFATGHQPISFAPAVVASLAGWQLTHPIELIPAREPCYDVRARLRTGWVVLFPGEYVAGITAPFDAPACLAAEKPIYDAGGVVVYGNPL